MIGASCANTLKYMRTVSSTLDLKLTCGNKSWLVHKSIISAASGVFSSLLERGFKESQQQQELVEIQENPKIMGIAIEIKDDDPEIFGIMIDFIYGCQRLINHGNILGVYSIGKKYLITSLVLYTLEKLRFLIDDVILFNAVQVSIEGSDEDCFQICATYMLWYYERIRTKPKYLELIKVDHPLMDSFRAALAQKTIIKTTTTDKKTSDPVKTHNALWVL